jgi:opacity protein-like surface antigen
MKLHPLAFAASFSALVLTANTFAGSWTDDDTSWKTASPYYYGDNTAPVQKDGYRYQSTRKRPKVRDHELRPFAPDSNNVSLDIGQNFLVGSDYQDSIGLAGTFTYGVSRLLAFSSSLGYSSHSDGAYSKLALTVGPRLNLASYDRIIPYVNCGLGFYRANRELTTNTSLSGTMFGVNFGGGADLQLTKETFFGAAMAYHELFGTKKETTIGTIDLASNYLTFMAHVGYTF